MIIIVAVIEERIIYISKYPNKNLKIALYIVDTKYVDIQMNRKARTDTISPSCYQFSTPNFHHEFPYFHL